MKAIRSMPPDDAFIVELARALLRRKDRTFIRALARAARRRRKEKAAATCVMEAAA